MKKSKFRSAYDIVLYLEKNSKKGLFTEESLYNALGRLIACKEIPEGSIRQQPVPTTTPDLLVLWIILGAGLIFFIFIFFWRKKKKKEEVK
jgi:hypothetical protein